jgi:hypothetical protein
VRLRDGLGKRQVLESVQGIVVHEIPDGGLSGQDVFEVRNRSTQVRM